MNRARISSLVSLLLLSLFGCLSSDRLPYKDDPLLAQRRPAEGNPENARPNLLLVAEPSPPTLPAKAFVLRPPANWPDTALVARPSEMPDNLAADRRNRPEFWTASRRKVAGTFGHAPDYTWLQGTVECVTGGVVELRYDSSSDGDAWGGRVRLERDTRLQQVQVGDVVMVEGELLLDHDPATPRLPLEAPAYQVRVLWLVRRPSGSF
jgi:hypothetical protein